MFLSSLWAVAPDTAIEMSIPWIAGLGAQNVKSTLCARSTGIFKGMISLLSMSAKLTLVNTPADVCAGLSAI